MNMYLILYHFKFYDTNEAELIKKNANKIRNVFLYNEIV